MHNAFLLSATHTREYLYLARKVHSRYTLSDFYAPAQSYSEHNTTLRRNDLLNTSRGFRPHATPFILLSAILQFVQIQVCTHTAVLLF